MGLHPFSKNQSLYYYEGATAFFRSVVKFGNCHFTGSNMSLTDFIHSGKITMLNFAGIIENLNINAQ